MKVPVIDQSSVSTQGEIAPSNGPALSRPAIGLESAAAHLGRGLSSVGRTYDRIEAEQERRDEEERRNANAVVEANADLELDTFAQRSLHGDGSPQDRADDTFGGADTSRGFLATQGLDAGRQSSDAIETLHKRRDEIADDISDQETKSRFLVRSAQRLAAYTAQIESHVSREFDVARSDTAKALVSQHLAASEAGSDFWARLVSSKQVEEHLRALAPTREGGDAAVTAFRSADAYAYTQGQLAQGNVDEAVNFVESNREALGSKYADAKRAVDAKVESTKRDQVNAETTAMVQDWADKARDANGFVTEDALRERAKQLPPEDPRRDELDAALDRQARVERARLDSKTKAFRDQAELAALVDGRRIPAEAVAHLRQYDPGALVAIREKQRAEFRRWKTEKDGSARDRAESRRAQGDADKVFLNELETELANNPQTDPGDFEKRWISRRVSEGENVTSPSDVARSRAGLTAAKAVKRDEKADSTERRQLAGRLERTIAAASKVRGKPLDQTQLNERVGRALALYDQRSADNGGKPLGESDLATLEADLMRSVVTEPGWFGTSIGQKRALTVDTVDAGTQAPSARRLVMPEKTIGAPTGPVKMRFPDGKTYDVPMEKLDAAKRKGGVRVE